ncbi:Zinc finger protein 207 [Auxenochlorella protothecoides]|uniref:Zinc finger protein 207 n=1 Tax=Auxenochlorella protothecoides TaxID=3075 RepID=A0A087SHC3_AUXPR|nr:Zinc finger protein 207 [Auxenochlorella protothecoides]KFM25127.1 Zinc finger protein 207 [Auxenochlorella protothecoides]
MVRKRRRQEEDVKPWCFYCDREFQDEATLITHQKSKHFKCETCHKRLVTVRALAVHSLQVMKPWQGGGCQGVTVEGLGVKLEPCCSPCSPVNASTAMADLLRAPL